MSDEHETFVAERCRDIVQLEAYANHEDAVIREGAVLGLQALRNRICDTLERLTYDPSPGVRAQAREE